MTLKIKIRRIKESKKVWKKLPTKTITSYEWLRELSGKISFSCPSTKSERREKIKRGKNFDRNQKRIFPLSLTEFLKIWLQKFTNEIRI